MLSAGFHRLVLDLRHVQSQYSLHLVPVSLVVVIILRCHSNDYALPFTVLWQVLGVIPGSVVWIVCEL